MTTKKIINLIATNNIHAFYKSKEWQEKRNEILRRQHFECQRCKQNHRLTIAQTSTLIVHHIKHLKSRPDLALVNSNLMAVCEACHNELHPEKLQNYNPKSRQWDDERW